MFDTLKIPQRVKSDIETAVDAGRIPAAIIFECSDEKTALKAANETAMAILCTSGLKPCGSCPACRKVLSGSHPDLHYLRKEESRATIKVDDIRELKRQAYMLPGDGDSSVFIIEGAQYLGPSGQNALLKVFEEPPAHVHFILVCSSRSSLLDTVLSRGTTYSLDTAEPEGRSLGKKEKRLQDAADELAADYCEKDELEFIIKLTDACGGKKDALGEILVRLQKIFRDALIRQHSSCEADGLTLPSESLSREINTQGLLRLYEKSAGFSAALEANANLKLLIIRISNEFFDIKTNERNAEQSAG